MCLIAIAWQIVPRWPLVLIGNRDEFHARPTAAAQFQPDAPQVYGGRDLEKQGGWLQMSTQRRLAAVTNVRTGVPEDAPLSRGSLVSDFVRADSSATDWFAHLAPHAARYGRFNLLAWDGVELHVATNHPVFASQRVEPGLYGVSNGSFDSDWPKVRRARAALRAWLAASSSPPDVAPLLAGLADEAVAPDVQLPQTGVALSMERLLSPAFIRGERYGTRSSSVVLIGMDEAAFVERRFGPGGVTLGESRQVLRFDTATSSWR